MKYFQQLNVAACTLAASVFFVFACNLRFWTTFVDATGGYLPRNIPLYLATFLILVLVLNALLTLFAFRLVLKPVLIVLFIATSFAAYFMNHYGVAIDAAMMQNVFETDFREAAELLNWSLVLTVALLGLLPSLLLWRVRIEAPPLVRNLLIKSGIVSVSLVLAAGLLLMFYKSYAPAFREHRELRLLLTPTNYLNAASSFLRGKARPVVVSPIGTDAIKGPLWVGARRRSVTVIVVGETARAMNFSLNGYGRETNP
ncbi:MAG TPA: phosphoethanolamine transferase domain-containing protein, partial [Burkholderiales bacterium]